jgi:beta-lactamase regulating signal transducer with metallopeptidase domain
VIGAFMTYMLIVSLLFGIAALGSEQTLALRSWPRRFVWVFALTASLVFPSLMALTTTPVVSQHAINMSADAVPITGYLPSNRSAAPAPGNASAVFQAAAPPSTRAAASPTRRDPVSVEDVLRIVWPATSVAALLFYALTWIRLGRATRRFPRIDVDGVVVRLTRSMGPAVFGFARPEILMPKWLLDVAPAVRSMALAHERQHIAGRDPLMLLVGLLLVAFAPWNPVLWWQLRRLRFAIEADCDARVLGYGADPSVYAEALLAVGQYRAALPIGFVALITPVSWLERRIRIIVSGTDRVSRVWASSGVAMSAALLIAVALLHAPGLAALAELRKLPPQDTKPAAQWAQSVVRTRFPELFERSFEGSAELAIVFNRDGSVLLADKHVSPPGARAPIDWRMSAQKKELGLDDEDVLYSDVEDIQAQDGRPDAMLGYIVYTVLKWPHDPARAEARVQTAVESYFPELRNPPPFDGSSCSAHVAVLMNDDGTVNRAQKLDIPCGGSWGGDLQERFAAQGVRPKELGRRGFFVLNQPGRRVTPDVMVNYAWPRHADDPSDIEDLSRGAVNRDFWTHHPLR